MAGVFNAIASLFRPGDKERQRLEMQASIIERERQRVMLRPRPAVTTGFGSEDLASLRQNADAAAERMQRNFWANPPHRQYHITRNGDRVMWHSSVTPRQARVGWSPVPSTWLHQSPPLTLRQAMARVTDDPKSWTPLLEELTEEESIVLRVAMDYVESKGGWRNDDDKEEHREDIDGGGAEHGGADRLHHG